MPTGRVINNSPMARIRNIDSPSSRLSQKTIGTGINLIGGSPIGLLLSLTYAANVTYKTINEYPYVRIRNTD